MSKPNEKAPGAPGAAPAQQGEQKHHAPAKPSGNSKGATIAVLPGMCMAEGCKEKSKKANFCMEHFDWFKEGLITKEGRKPSDFDKKHFDYMRRKNKKVA